MMPNRDKAPETTKSKGEGEKREYYLILDRIILPTLKDSYEGIKSIVKSLGSSIYTGIKSLGSSIYAGYAGYKNLSHPIKNPTSTQDRGKEGMVEISNTNTSKVKKLNETNNPNISIASSSEVIPALDVDTKSKARDNPKIRTKINHTEATTTHAQRFSRLTTANTIGHKTGGGGRGH